MIRFAALPATMHDSDDVPDRLSELRRQRALVREHLAWLDGEIARQEKPASLEPPNHPTVPAESLPDVSAPVAEAGNSEAILDKYRVNPTTLQTDVRRGCLFYFVGAFVLLGLIVAGLYFLLRHK